VRAGIVTAAVASGLALVVAAAQAQAGPPARPNILVIVSDDHSAAFVGAYGNRDVLTPSLDGLAAAGARFDRAYVTAPQCLPSRASFMTGQTPIRIGVSRFTAPVPPEVPMFPEALREAGYFTGLAGRSHHLQGAAHNAEVVEIYRRLGLLSVERRFDVVQEAGGAGGDQQGENALKQFAGFLDRVPPGNRSSCNWGSPTRIVRSTPHDSSRGTTRRS
jgi:arylsulfatase A-like enzyme